MSHASGSVHAAIIVALKNALNDVPVYDDVPPSSPGRFVTVASGIETPANMKGLKGQETIVEVHQWDSSVRGRMGVLALQGTIYTALDGASIPISGLDLTSIDHEFSTNFLDEDGLTIHGVMRFRVRTTG